MNFSKSVKLANMQYNAYQTILFLKNVFSTLIVKVLLQKTESF